MEPKRKNKRSKAVPRGAPKAAELCTLLAKARRVTWAAATRRLEAQGESMHAWQVVNKMLQLGPCTQRELAEGTSQHPAGVCRLLEELEGQGLVQRRRVPADRRKLVVQVTARGRRWFEGVNAEVAASNLSALACLSEAEQASLRKLLFKLVGEPG